MRAQDCKGDFLACDHWIPDEKRRTPESQAGQGVSYFIESQARQAVSYFFEPQAGQGVSYNISSNHSCSMCKLFH